MKTKYFNDAIIGNKDMLVSLSKTGELLRLYYPMRDNKQYIDFFETGVKINDSMLIYTNNDVNNEYNQKYIENTNVLETDILNTYFKLRIVQTDFVSINENVLILGVQTRTDNLGNGVKTACVNDTTLADAFYLFWSLNQVTGRHQLTLIFPVHHLLVKLCKRLTRQAMPSFLLNHCLIF